MGTFLAEHDWHGNLRAVSAGSLVHVERRKCGWWGTFAILPALGSRRGCRGGRGGEGRCGATARVSEARAGVGACSEPGRSSPALRTLPPHGAKSQGPRGTPGTVPGAAYLVRQNLSQCGSRCWATRLRPPAARAAKRKAGTNSASCFTGGGARQGRNSAELINVFVRTVHSVECEAMGIFQAEGWPGAEHI